MVSPGMGLLAGQDEAAWDLVAVGRVEATWEATQVTVPMAEEAMREASGAQAMSPVG